MCFLCFKWKRQIIVKDIDEEEIIPGEWNYYFSDGKDGHWRITCSSDFWSNCFLMQDCRLIPYLCIP